MALLFVDWPVGLVRPLERRSTNEAPKRVVLISAGVGALLGLVIILLSTHISLLYLLGGLVTTMTSVYVISMAIYWKSLPDSQVK